MKTVVIILIKKIREGKGKKILKVNGVPLYAITLKKLKKCNFDEVYVDTDSQEIKKYCLKNNINIINRLRSLSKNTANGNDLLNYHLKIIEADIYFQLFITAPLLKISTINKCIEILKKSKKHDSIMTVRSLYTWFWFNNRAINYDPRILPRSQDAKPVVVETTALYGIKRRSLKKENAELDLNLFFMKLPKENALI